MVIYTVPNSKDPKSAGFSITTEHVAIVAGLAAAIWGRGTLRWLGAAGIAYGALSLASHGLSAGG